MSLVESKQPILVKSKIKLTIGILVSDRIKYIRKAMEALKPLLEAVPSELIIVDTKGDEGDGSIDICREYTDKIYSFTWCNDFSAARNVCLENARGEWFMYQDDDEWFDDVQELIEFFNSGECERYFSGCYYVKNYDILGDSTLGIVGRMIRRHDNTHFVGRIHEGFNEAFGPCKQFDSFVHHMGYAYYTVEDKKQHQERNLSLLKVELQEKGYTPRNCAQIVQELLASEDTAKEGFEFAQKSMQKIVEMDEVSDSLSQWIITAMVKYCAVYGTYEQTKNQAAFVRAEYRLSQIAELVVAYLMIRASVEADDTECVLENVNIYLKEWDWLQANPDELILQTQLDMPKYYTKECIYDVLYEGARAENNRGYFKAAMTYWNRMPWKDEGFDGSRYFEELQVTQNGYKELLAKKQKEQIYLEMKDLRSVIYEAEPVIRQLLSEERKREAVDLLAGLQETVITLENKVESWIGEGAEQIHVLEHCCEILWLCANTEEKEEAFHLLDEFYAIVGNLVTEE